MSVHLALLRAVNVGGRKSILMAELRDLLTSSAFVGVRSLLQTGNLVFRSKRAREPTLKASWSRRPRSASIFRPTFLFAPKRSGNGSSRTTHFQRKPNGDPAHLVVMFLKRAPSAKEVEALQAAITGPEIVSVNGREAYIVYPAGIGRSRLTNPFVEKKLRHPRHRPQLEHRPETGYSCWALSPEGRPQLKR